MDYPPLVMRALDRGVAYHQPTQQLPARVTLDSPALDVMTDLRRVTAITTGQMSTLDQANGKMIRRGVRLLFVVDESNAIIGLVTASDLTGEKPMQVVQKTGKPRRDILVCEIMTPQARLEVLDMADVSRSKVGHVVATLKQLGRQHALTVDAAPDGRQTVRGIFSLTQISRQLGVEIHATEIASTFAEIEALLMH